MTAGQFKLNRAEERGHFDHDWLQTWHSFSFAEYHNPHQMNFGVLRVLNDDIIAPKQGFGLHPHSNMEIITIPISGTLLHHDSMGNEQTITANEVQVITAGSGIYHSEYNASETAPLKLLQIWIFPQERGLPPAYSQKEFKAQQAVNQWQLLVGEAPTALKIRQNVKISRLLLSSEKTIDYPVMPTSLGTYIFVIEGNILINEQELNTKDALEIHNCSSFSIKAIEDSHVLNIEVPDDVESH